MAAPELKPDATSGDTGDRIFIGKGEETAWLTLGLANRHGLVTGATGTGKTVSLQVMAEGFARAGVPVFAADIKGDLSGISEVGEAKDFILQRAKEMALTFQPDQFSTVFWDVFGEQGHPVRATVSEMGPLLLARLLDLNDVQEGVLNVAFRVADENGLTLLDMKDLRALLDAIVPMTAKKDEIDPLADVRKSAASFGNVTKATVGTIQRQLLVLENQGADKFFGEPALDLKDFIKTDRDGRGMVNILVADKLMSSPQLYATFLLWLLSELFEQLPEVGDLDQPKMVFFFDEAHLLFDDASPALQQRVEQVVRLIRSKGVGVYFCSQNPDDVPGVILGQLGNRIQHALRAFTPRDQKAVKAAAETFVANPKLDVVTAITQLAVGEALASTLANGGVPTPVEQVLVTSPCCRIGAITEVERSMIRQRSPVGSKYDTTVNRESAAEMLAKRASEKAADASSVATTAGGKAADQTAPAESPGWGGAVHDALFGTKRRQGMVETMGKQVVRTMGSQLGRQILRGVLGGIFGGKR
jgi:DNA helicase HerA-like ATPase